MADHPIPEATDQMLAWYNSLRDPADRAAVDVAVDKLHEMGTTLGRPHADTLHGGTSGLKELRARQTLRIFYIFDPRGIPILLNGGDKKGQDQRRWYNSMMAAADQLYLVHLNELRTEGLLPDNAPRSPRSLRATTAGASR